MLGSLEYPKTMISNWNEIGPTEFPGKAQGISIRALRPVPSTWVDWNHVLISGSFSLSYNYSMENPHARLAYSQEHVTLLALWLTHSAQHVKDNTLQSSFFHVQIIKLALVLAFLLARKRKQWVMNDGQDARVDRAVTCYKVQMKMCWSTCFPDCALCLNLNDVLRILFKIPSVVNLIHSVVENVQAGVIFSAPISEMN